MSAAERVPVAPTVAALCPHQRGRDAALEILEEVADIVAMPIDEWKLHRQLIDAEIERFRWRNRRPAA